MGINYVKSQFDDLFAKNEEDTETCNKFGMFCTHKVVNRSLIFKKCMMTL